MSSLEECPPKRPPRVQKFPLASGTVQFDTTCGYFSMVVSTNHTICRASPHSSRKVSLTIITNSRSPLSASLANSSILMRPSGIAVCAPTSGVMGISAISG